MTCLVQRQTLLCLIDQAIAAGARQARASAVVGLSCRTLQRWRTTSAPGDQRPLRVQQPRNQLSDMERQHLLSVVNSDEFGHLAPSQIVPRLADQGIYLASESTMYRVLRDAGQLMHRRPERRATSRAKPQALTATAPNQVYSWDITYLPTAVKGEYFYLYLFLDIFSRKVVGWQVFDAECGGHAADVLRDICWREAVARHQLVLHSDNGGPMKGATMLATLRELGVAPSFSRPAVSNDNPYSESLFKTLKYRPAHPCKPFANLQTARAWVAGFVRWYNTEHCHSAIRFVTPQQRHNGHDRALLQRRHVVYEVARKRHPHRWTGSTRNWSRVDEVHLNPHSGATKTAATPSTLKRAA